MLIHWTDKVGTERDEFVVADNIQQVIEYSCRDLQDAGLEVEGIVKEIPITTILSKKWM
jgi:hypothetical protein